MNKKAKCPVKVRGLLCFIAVFSLAVNLHARPQEEVRITLKLDEATLETAIDSIEEQSSYLFMNNGVNLQRTVSLSVSNCIISEVCELLFTPIRVDYRIDGHHIYISNRPEPVPVKISGTILDQSGYPVPGASTSRATPSPGRQ